MTSTNIPEYLDPESMGGWVFSAQEQMVRSAEMLALQASPPAPTGVHTGSSLTFVQNVQGVWGIDTDGGMGPGFRNEYQTRTGHLLLNPAGNGRPQAPTIAIGPNDKHGAMWIPGRDNAPVADQRQLTITTFGDQHRPSMSGGNGTTYLTPEHMDRLKEEVQAIQKVNGQVLLIIDKHVNRSSPSDWQSRWGYGKDKPPIPIDFMSRSVPSPIEWLKLIHVTKVPLLVVMSEKARRDTGY